MRRLILAAGLALAGLPTFAAVASAQAPARFSQPRPAQLALLFRIPIKTQPKPRSPGVGFSFSASTLSVWRQTPLNRVAAEPDAFARRWPFRADPRRWPRLFANTTECSLSFDPILRRHWFN